MLRKRLIVAVLLGLALIALLAGPSMSAREVAVVVAAAIGSAGLATLVAAPERSVRSWLAVLQGTFVSLLIYIALGRWLGDIVLTVYERLEAIDEQVALLTIPGEAREWIAGSVLWLYVIGCGASGAVLAAWSGGGRRLWRYGLAVGVAAALLIAAMMLPEALPFDANESDMRALREGIGFMLICVLAGCTGGFVGQGFVASIRRVSSRVR